eukprot:7162486-Heterocapsa_arctica.AAC.1
MTGPGGWLVGLDERLLDQRGGQGSSTNLLQRSIGSADDLLLHAVRQGLVGSTHCTPLRVHGGSRAHVDGL